MKVKNVNIDDINPYENNPRINDMAVDTVAASIEKFGWRQPIVIDINNTIVAGHTRYKAALKLGHKTIPCVIADDLTDAEIKAYRLADNKVAEGSSWDDDLLIEELEALAAFESIDMSEFGFDIALELANEITDAYADNTDESPGAGAKLSDGSSFSYKEQYGVIVMCRDESEQEKIYNHLLEEGYDCKVVAT